jgi:tryptophan 2,3-dioxygenase
MELTYASYLKVDKLLSLQDLQSESEEHDEMLFIIIHQTYELWFKQILHELNFMCRNLDKNKITRAAKAMKRVNTILKVIVHQVDILETMTPLEFNSFRNYLQSASGFQSYQFRELEFFLGNKKELMIEYFENNPEVHSRLRELYQKPTVWDKVLQFLSANNHSIPKEFLERDYTKPYEANEAVQDILINIYKEALPYAGFLELLLDFDEGLQEWRYRHVKMVERTIGTKMGTGGSDGAEYLKKTLFQPVFPDLWAIRSRFEQ